MTRNSILGLGFASLATLGLAVGSAQAQTVGAAKATLTASGTATPTATETDNAVVTQIIGTPTTSETFLIQDATGAIEVYKASTTSYTPAVGDMVSVTSGAITSFHGLFEFETGGGHTLTVLKTGTAALPAPAAFTVAGLQNGSPVGFTQQSMLGTLRDVTFNGSNATGTFASGTYSVTDGSGLNATIYVPSTDSAVIGTAIPTGAVDITGYLGQFGAKNTGGGPLTTFGAGAVSNDGYELDPLSFTPAAAPEPSSVAGMVIGIGLLGLVAARRRYSVK